MHFIPASLRCLRIYNGIWLRPELLLALNACLIVCVSSAGVIYYVAGVASGVYSSYGSVLSWNILLLCAANSWSLSAEVSPSLVLIIFQNYLG
jgi:hypothetical protein